MGYCEIEELIKHLKAQYITDYMRGKKTVEVEVGHMAIILDLLEEVKNFKLFFKNL